MDLIDSPIWHPYTPVPHSGPRAKFVCASGAYVYDEAGKKYLDATSSWWCNIHGHCHPRLVAALSRQAEILDQILLAPHTHPVAEKLADRLLELLPFAGKVFYSDDGSTAVEVAMKIAIQFWKNRGFRKTRFLCIDGAYHGDTFGTMSVSGVEKFKLSSSDGNVRSAMPDCYRCPVGKQFPGCQIECLDELESTDCSDVAALIVEPLVLGASGMITYPKQYLERLVKFARDRELLIIFDEVFTGFGRTGTMFAFEQLDAALRPDMICLSKGLTAGMLPLGVTATTRRIFDSFTGTPDRALYHGHTFTGNALSIAVALESLNIFEQERTLDRNQDKIAWMASQKERFSDLPHVRNVRQLGMIWAFENPSNAWGWKVAEQMWDLGYWFRPLHQHFYFIPPYCTTLDEIKQTFDDLYRVLKGAKHANQ